VVKKNIKLILLGVLFLFIGIVGFTFPFLPFYVSADFQFLNEIAKEKNTDGPQLVPVRSTNYNSADVKERLTISKIGVDMPVLKSDDSSVLKKGGWLFPGTSTPDKGGNSVIFGHRFRYKPPISNTFYKLNELKIGDTFSVNWNGEEYIYQITEVKIIEPTDMSVLDQTEKSKITLITCAPLFSTKQRLVVIGELI